MKRKKKTKTRYQPMTYVSPPSSFSHPSDQSHPTREPHQRLRRRRSPSHHRILPTVRIQRQADTHQRRGEVRLHSAHTHPDASDNGHAQGKRSHRHRPHRIRKDDGIRYLPLIEPETTQEERFPCGHHQPNERVGDTDPPRDQWFSREDESEGMEGLSAGEGRTICSRDGQEFQYEIR